MEFSKQYRITRDVNAVRSEFLINLIHITVQVACQKSRFFNQGNEIAIKGTPH